MAILKVINGGYTESNVYQNLMNYIFKEDNTYRHCYGCQYIYNNGNEGVAMQLQAIAEYYHQMSGVLLHHYVVSFSSIYEGWINPLIALNIVEQAMTILPYAAIWCVHGDTKNLHIHIIMSPVDFTTGLKYENRKDSHKTLAGRITLFEQIERRKLEKIYANSYDFIGENPEEVYTKVPDCLIVYE